MTIIREVLFKAKLKDWETNSQQNKWVEGYYLSRKETTYCFTEDYDKFPVKILHYIAVDSMTDWGLPNEFRYYEIDPDTLCQYTGQNDMDDNMIWENDCIGHKLNIVEFFNDGWCINGDSPLSCVSKYYKIIGNIFDNPELLKGEVNECK